MLPLVAGSTSLGCAVIRFVLHGGGFTMLGFEDDLDWFGRCISERYEVKFRGRVGPVEKWRHEFSYAESGG